MALLFWKLSRSLAWHCWEVEIDDQNGPPAGGATGPALPHIWEDGSELKLSENGGDNYGRHPFRSVALLPLVPTSGQCGRRYWIDDVAVSKSHIDCPTSK